jgi:predicted DNA-binding protein YlxM (UPF0122 family)
VRISRQNFYDEIKRAIQQLTPVQNHFQSLYYRGFTHEEISKNSASQLVQQNQTCEGKKAMQEILL